MSILLAHRHELTKPKRERDPHRFRERFEYEKENRTVNNKRKEIERKRLKGKE